MIICSCIYSNNTRLRVLYVINAFLSAELSHYNANHIIESYPSPLIVGLVPER